MTPPARHGDMIAGVNLLSWSDDTCVQNKTTWIPGVRTTRGISYLLKDLLLRLVDYLLLRGFCICFPSLFSGTVRCYMAGSNDDGRKELAVIHSFYRDLRVVGTCEGVEENLVSDISFL